MVELLKMTSYPEFMDFLELLNGDRSACRISVPELGIPFALDLATDLGLSYGFQKGPEYNQDIFGSQFGIRNVSGNYEF